MRRALPLIALVVGGCFNPDDLLPVSSRLISDGGVAGQRVELFRGEVPTWPGGCPSPRFSKETTAAADGAFTLEVLRAQAQRLTVPGNFCFVAKTRFASGTGVEATFRNVNADYELPPLVDWDPGFRSTATAASFSFAVATPPTLERPAGFADAFRAEVVTPDGGLVWAKVPSVITSINGAPGRGTLGFSAEELEDFPGSVQLVTRFVFAGIIVSPGQHEDVTMDLRAGATLAAGGVTVPFSRGLSCPPFDDPCPFTDGKLDRADAGGVTTISLRWGLPRIASRLLVRGAEYGPTSMTVQVFGEDGGVLTRRFENWAPNRWDVPPELWPADEFVPLEEQLAGQHAVMRPRFVRLGLDGNRATTGIDLSFSEGLSAATEISVFQ